MSSKSTSDCSLFLYTFHFRGDFSHGDSRWEAVDVLDTQLPSGPAEGRTLLLDIPMETLRRKFLSISHLLFSDSPHSANDNQHPPRDPPGTLSLSWFISFLHLPLQYHRQVLLALTSICIPTTCHHLCHYHLCRSHQ